MSDIKEIKKIASSLTLLYVEDDTEIAQAFIAYLSKIFKEVVYAENGEEGLSLYKQDDFDLVITDINMPKMNGMDMSREIRNISSEQNIIIVSAHTELENFTTSIKLGIDGYIIKPINYTDLNNLLFKVVQKINIYKENKINTEQQKTLLSQVSKNNTQLRQYNDMLNKVAIVSKTDLKGNITYVNDLYCDVSGYSKDESIGLKQNATRCEDVHKSLYEELWNTIKSGKTWKGTIKNKSKSGEEYFVNATIIPLHDEANNICEYIGIHFLITEEENKKRDFKKKVMTGYKEFRKHSYDANKNIESLSKEVTNLKEGLSYEKYLMDEYKIKNQKQMKQIKFYEKELNEKNTKIRNLLEKANENINSVTSLYEKSLKKIKTMSDELKYFKKE